MMKGNKGAILGSGILQIVRLGILAILVLFVSLAAGGAMESKQDVRKLESSLISQEIMDCISEKGVISKDFDIKGCIRESDEVFAKAYLLSLESDLSANSSTGFQALEVFCKQGQPEKRGYPSCGSQRYYILIDNDGKTEKGTLDLLIGIRKYEKNI